MKNLRPVLLVLLSFVIAACTSNTQESEHRQEPTETPDPTLAASPEDTAAARFEVGECPFDVPEGAPVECGVVVVPEDHIVPDGRTIRLATVIVKDQSADHQPDPVILLAGTRRRCF